MEKLTTDILILGAGPAGISAALYAVRGGADVTVVSNGTSALNKAEKIENYYGFSEPISGEELLKNGIANAKRLGVRVEETELLSVRMNDTLNGFIAETKSGSMEARAVILAAGASRVTPKLKGITELEGHGVSYCAVCDAFFYRKKKVAVIGAGAYAAHEASVLVPHAETVALLTDGEPMPPKLSEGIEVITKKLVAVEGNEKVSGVRFEDGTELELDGVFVAIGVAGSTSIARTMGIITEGNSIKTDEHMATNIPGVFAAGDCTGGLLQVAKAVYQGAEAGLSALKYVRR